MRQIVLDTETTGLSHAEGHRIIEVGCVELINRKLTGNRFHVYINPDRVIDPGAVEVHGLDSHFLSDKPRFGEIAADLWGFLVDAELVIHNAPFDLGFLNAEFGRVLPHVIPVEEHCSILDTLALARGMHPGQRNTLDALCKRYSVNNSMRTLHGALLDAEILADVYLAMTGGQSLLFGDISPPDDSVEIVMRESAVPKTFRERSPLRVVPCDDKALAEHQRVLEAINKYCEKGRIWK